MSDEEKLKKYLEDAVLGQEAVPKPVFPQKQPPIAGINLTGGVSTGKTAAIETLAEHFRNGAMDQKTSIFIFDEDNIVDAKTFEALAPDIWMKKPLTPAEELNASVQQGAAVATAFRRGTVSAVSARKPARFNATGAVNAR